MEYHRTKPTCLQLKLLQCLLVRDPLQDHPLVAGGIRDPAVVDLEVEEGLVVDLEVGEAALELGVVDLEAEEVDLEVEEADLEAEEVRVRLDLEARLVLRDHRDRRGQQEVRDHQDLPVHQEESPLLQTLIAPFLHTALRSPPWM
jgi:hypothetical protein